MEFILKMFEILQEEEARRLADGLEDLDPLDVDIFLKDKAYDHATGEYKVEAEVTEEI